MKGNQNGVTATAPSIDVKTREIPCPYIYSNGRNCPGRITYIWRDPRSTSHYWSWHQNQWTRSTSRGYDKVIFRLTCSEHDQHQGKFSAITDVDKLPAEVRTIIEQIKD